MPSEAAIKAQIAAAILKKKQAVEEVKSPTPEPEAAPAPTPEPTSKPAPIVVEPKPEPIAPSTDRRPPVADTTSPNVLTFFGQNIRIATQGKEVFFAIDDVLQLSNDPDCQTKFIEYKNQPSTKTKAASLIKSLTFVTEEGSDKADGANATNILTIMRELGLTMPGPFGRWAMEITQSRQ